MIDFQCRVVVTPKKLMISVPSPRTPASASKMTPEATIMDLMASNALLEKEVKHYRKEMQADVKRFEDESRSLISDNGRLKELNHALEDKLSIVSREKMEQSLLLQSVKSELRELQSERDRSERDVLKQVQRLEGAKVTVSEKNRNLTKERIDLQNQLNSMAVKIRDLESICAKYERAQVNTGSEAHQPSNASLKVKENEIRRLQRANQLLISNKTASEKSLESMQIKEQALKQTVADLEMRLGDLEQENTILTMKIDRLEVSHEYAGQLEDQVEKLSEKLHAQSIHATVR